MYLFKTVMYHILNDKVHTETKWYIILFKPTSNNILLLKLAFILTVNIFVNNWQSFGQALYPNCGLEEGECTVILS